MDNIDGFLDGLSTLAVGFSAGALAVVSGGSSIGAAIGVGVATSAVTSFNNEMVAQTGANFTSDGNINWDNVWMSTVSGAVAGAASGAVGSWASSANITVNGMSSPLLNSAVTSTMSAGAGHIAGGTSYNLMSGQGLSEAFQNSLYGVGKSMLLGGVIGMGTTTATCLANGINPIDGGELSFKFREMCNDPLLFDQKPSTLQEQYAIEEAFSAPGYLVFPSSEIGDPKWQGWNKMQYIHHGLDGSKINVHYYQHTETGVKSGFKIKY